MAEGGSLSVARIGTARGEMLGECDHGVTAGAFQTRTGTFGPVTAASDSAGMTVFAVIWQLQDVSGVVRDGLAAQHEWGVALGWQHDMRQAAEY